MLPDDNRAELTVNKGRVNVNNNWDDNRNDDLWLAAASRNFLLSRGIRTLSLSLSLSAKTEGDPGGSLP